MTYRYKGYTLKQTIDNYYRIASPSGEVVMHIPYAKPLSEEEAKDKINKYLKFKQTLNK